VKEKVQALNRDSVILTLKMSSNLNGKLQEQYVSLTCIVLDKYGEHAPAEKISKYTIIVIRYVSSEPEGSQAAALGLPAFQSCRRM